ncbi:DUF2070 family protein [Candidatus Bathyarchaeota archaeon]|nr:DUF2070 family protein [Candidatus Bathyarchaeota archaeon]
MASNNHKEEYVNKAVRHYSSLFRLPSHLKIVVLLFIFCIVGGISTVFPLNRSYLGLTSGLLFGIAFFFITLSADVIIHYSWMKKDPILNLRRCSALSLFSCLFWFVFIFIGSILILFVGSPNIWVKLFLVGFCATLILRLLVFYTVSFANFWQIILSSFLQPVLCNILLFFLGKFFGYSLSAHHLLFLLFSIPIALSANIIFVYFVNRVGKKIIGITSLSLLKAFLANWTEDLIDPLESFFDKLGYEQEIKISLLAFREKKKIKAVMIVPAFHPGPFKNVGSSALPYMIQNKLENKLQCIVAVPHGLSGHELNLTSQLQNQKVMDRILGSLDFSTFSSRSTPFMRTKIKGATATCQIFGECALISLTIAPQTMEDLPRELDDVIVNEAEKRGLTSAIVIDAHNSIKGPFNLEKAIDPLRKAAVSGLEEALLHTQTRFEVGAARIVPEEFSVKEGMGPGGISVLVMKVNDQKIAYITIDGNNIISGLREKILLAVQEIGITDGEVFTTDTHTVNSTVLTKRGYHPIGEAIDQTKLIDYIKQATTDALSDLEPAEVSWRTETIHKVKVMGEKQIEALSLTTDETVKLSKKLAASVFSLTGVLLTILIILL